MTLVGIITSTAPVITVAQDAEAPALSAELF